MLTATITVFFNKAWLRIRNEVAYPWRPKKWPLLTRIRRFIVNTELPPPERIIDVAPFPSHITPDGVAHFPRNGRPEADKINEEVIKPDVIVFATGYVPTFPFFNTSHNAGRRAYPQSHDANVRNIWHTNDPTIGFIGFIRPGFGAIPPLAELQAMLFTMNLVGRVPAPLDPEDEWHYRIIQPPSARLQYGVEHDSYAYQLAKDIGGAPSISDIVHLSLTTPHGWRLPWIWAAGANFVVKFRMIGPWRWAPAAETMTGELWQTITRRANLFGNAFMAAGPLIYLGLVNLFFFVYGTVWGALASVGLARPVTVDNAVKRRFQELADREAKMNKMANGTSSYAAKAALTNGVNGHVE